MGNADIQGANGQITVTLVDKVLFESGEADLSAEGEQTLQKLGTVLKNVDKLVEVAGHADTQPVKSEIRELYPTNWELPSPVQKGDFSEELAAAEKTAPKTAVEVGAQLALDEERQPRLAFAGTGKEGLQVARGRPGGLPGFSTEDVTQSAGLAPPLRDTRSVLLVPVRSSARP